MTRAVRDRRWRQRVLLVGVFLLAVSAILLLQGSRPQAGEPDDASIAGGWRAPGRGYSFWAGTASGGPALEDGDEPEEEELKLTLIDALSGQLITETDLDLTFGDSENDSRRESTDAEGVLSWSLSDEDRLALESAPRIEVDAVGYLAASLSATEVQSLLEKGSGTVRLLPLAKLIARMAGPDGEPVNDFQLCFLEDENDEPSCEYSSEGAVTIDDLPLGDRQLWASSSAAEDDEDQRDHVVFQTLRFAPGEQKTVTLRASSRLGLTATVLLVDSAGQPVAGDLVDVRLGSREPAASRLDRALLSRAEQNQESTSQGVSWRLPRGGWYTVKVGPKHGAERLLAEGSLFAGEGPSTLTLRIPERPIRCRLLATDGAVVPVRGYSATVVSEDGRDGFGGGGLLADLRFFWPKDATQIEVSLTGRTSSAFVRGKLTLRDHAETCDVKGTPRSAD